MRASKSSSCVITSEVAARLRSERTVHQRGRGVDRGRHGPLIEAEQRESNKPKHSTCIPVGRHAGGLFARIANGFVRSCEPAWL